jgi:hypothetical protein
VFVGQPVLVVSKPTPVPPDDSHGPAADRAVLRQAEEEVADLHEFVQAVAAKHDATAEPVRRIRAAQTAISAVKPLQAAKEAREALRQKVEAFLHETAAELFRVTLIEQAFKPK